ncbi:MAG: hypothetical protein ACK40O_01915 [Allosphingosinicella sp.]
MRRLAVATLFGAALGVAGCATYYDDDRYGGGYGYGDYAYDGRDYQRIGNECGAFGGSGGHRLDPWLACTQEGRQIVRMRFDGDDDGRIGARTADDANIWFRRHADTNRDMRLTDPEIRAALVNVSRHDRRY